MAIMIAEYDAQGEGKSLGLSGFYCFFGCDFKVFWSFLFFIYLFFYLARPSEELFILSSSPCTI
jgi:hypothetical protein